MMLSFILAGVAVAKRTRPKMKNRSDRAKSFNVSVDDVIAAIPPPKDFTFKRVTLRTLTERSLKNIFKNTPWPHVVVFKGDLHCSRVFEDDRNGTFPNGAWSGWTFKNRTVLVFSDPHDAIVARLTA